MLLKKLFPAMALCVSTLIAGHACAFNLPSNFTSLNDHNLTRQVSHPQTEAVKAKILAEYSQWKGTRYHLGGHSHRGIDCSALMQEIFQGSMRMNLPRTTGEQMHNGYRISKGELKPGDLVFFKTSRATRHVGVYVGNNEFIHASKKKGVTVSNLDNEYWLAHYETARRLDADA